MTIARLNDLTGSWLIPRVLEVSQGQARPQGHTTWRKAGGRLAEGWRKAGGRLAEGWLKVRGKGVFNGIDKGKLLSTVHNSVIEIDFNNHQFL